MNSKLVAYVDEEGTWVGYADNDAIVAEMYEPDFAGLFAASPDLYEALDLLQSSLPDLPYLIGALKRAGMDQEDVRKVMEAVGRMNEVLAKTKGDQK